MANLYNMNRRTLIDDEPLISWKGKAFTQITSIIKQNKPSSVSTSNTKGIIFLPNALKIFRREISSNMDLSGCHSSRVSLKIDELNSIYAYFFLMSFFTMQLVLAKLFLSTR
jgi:hypothetical protein